MYSSITNRSSNPASTSIMQQESSWHMDMKEAIQRQDPNAVHARLAASATTCTNKALLDLLAYAYQCQSSQPVINALKHHDGFDIKSAIAAHGQTYLKAAVKSDNIEFATYLLAHGANPELEKADHSCSLEMRKRLDFAARKNKLYPANRDEPAALLHQGSTSIAARLHAQCAIEGAKTASGHARPLPNNPSDKPALTELDKALQEFRIDDAEALLQHERNNHATDQGLWLAAVQNNRRDILRAMLLLRNDSAIKALNHPQDEYPLQKAFALKDAALSDAIKEFPYLSAKRGYPQYLNMEAPFNNGEPIVCRHLATHQQDEQAEHPEIKFDYSTFRSVSAIAANVKPDTQMKWQKLRARASEKHLIDNAKFGQFLMGQFAAMEKENQTTQLMLVESTNHAMNLGLRIKEKNGKKSYVVKFFDPNMTTTGTRSKASSLQTFESQEIGTYLLNEEDVKAYYPEKNGVSAIFVRPPLKGGRNVEPSTQDRNRVPTRIHCEKIDSTVMWHLMATDSAENLRQLRAELKDLPLAELIEVLAAKNSGDNSGLLLSMQDGHIENIKAYGELLELIPAEHRIDLIRAPGSGKVSGLLAALLKGHAEAIDAYGELLKLVPAEHWVDLIRATEDNGTSGLFFALAGGHTEAIKAYGELLKRVPASNRLELLIAKDQQGIPGLHMACFHGHADAVAAYGELLKLVPETDQTALLSVKDPQGTPSLHMAALNGHADIVAKYEGLLELLPVSERTELLAELQVAKDLSNLSRLFRDMYDGNFKAATEFVSHLFADASEKQIDPGSAFEKLLNEVPEKYRLAFFIKNDAYGVPEFPKALTEGNRNAISLYSRILALLPESEQVEVLASDTLYGVPLLHMLLQNENAMAIEMYGELLQLVPETDRAKLLAAPDQVGRPGLHMALSKCNATAIAAYGGLLKLVPETDRVELLAAMDPWGVPGLYRALCPQLIAAMDPWGFPGLYRALCVLPQMNANATAIAAYGGLLKLVPETDRAKLLAAKEREGTSGLYKAMFFGQATLVAAFGEQLKLIPEKERTELLAAKDFRGTPGLFSALCNNHAEVIAKYGEQLELIQENDRMMLLSAKDADGVSGLLEAMRAGNFEALDQYAALVSAMALQKGHADTDTIYAELLLNAIPEESRAELLAEQGPDGIPAFQNASLSDHAGSREIYAQLLKSVGRVAQV